jgi:hypothetical protein
MVGGMPLEAAFQASAADVFSFAKWGSVSDKDQRWSFLTGDFDGDGHLDIFAHEHNSGNLFVHINKGDHFETEQWATKALSSYGNWSFWTGDFNGDGRLDVAACESKSGNVFVLINKPKDKNNPAHFERRQWATASGGNWSFWTGDFNGDGRPDIGAHESRSGNVFVHINKGKDKPAETQQWGAVSHEDQRWSFLTGDFDGDGHLDVLGYESNSGNLCLGRNMGDAFYFGKKAWGSNPNGPGQLIVLPGLFTMRNDIFACDPNGGSLWVGTNTGLPPEGYAWPLSAGPGDTIKFWVSGVASPTAEFFRYTAGAGGVVSTKMGKPVKFVPVVRAVQAHSWANGAGWKKNSFSLRIPPDWPSGIYSARLTSAERKNNYSHVTFVVKPDKRRSSVAVLANINTWLAYNTWGGRSKYTSPAAAHSSFLRPAPDTDPFGEDDDAYHQTRAELWILGWLEEELKHPPDVYTDLDFHNRLIKGYKKLVIGTHSEYWSTQMYDNLKGFLDSGGSLIYLGGNGIYEVGTYYEPDKTGMIFLNGNDNETDRTTWLFRNQNRPESSLLGVATAAFPVAGSRYIVLQSGHTFFNGMKFKDGDPFGASGLNTGKGNTRGAASAWEVDDARNGPLPDGTQVLANAGTPAPGGFRNKPGTGADMTIYQHRTGKVKKGWVFSAGSISFGGSLVIDGKIQEIVRRALKL